MKNSRRKAREVALKILYQREFQSPPAEKDLDKWLLSFFEEKPPSKEQKSFIKEILRGLESNKDAIDEEIKTNSKNWKINRMALVDLSILRIAIFEMLFKPDIPPKVSLNEALELAKIYGDKGSGPFINGILDQVLKGHTKPA